MFLSDQRQDFKKIAPILGLFALILLYFGDSLTGRSLFVERDLTSFFYPFRIIWVETVRHGHFPFWNPYIKCGVPLFATIQPAVLYPLSLPYLFLPLDLAFNWTIIFHFFLAGVFTYMLMKELGTSTQGSLAAAIAFIFGGYLISVHNVLNTLLSVSWYPLVMFCGCRLVRSGKARWAVACGFSLCFMFLGGGIEILIFAGASLLILCLYPKILPLGGAAGFPSLIRRLGLLGLALIVFLGLSMVQLLPFLELYRLSDRSGGMTLEQVTTWSLAPRDLIYMLIPDLYGSRLSPDRYWRLQNYLKTIYVGPICLFFAGIYFLRQGRQGLLLLASMGLVLVLALGRHTPVFPFFFKYFPLFGSLRYPVKFVFLFVFYLCVASGLGLDMLRKRFSEKHRPKLWRQGLLVAFVLVLAGLLLLVRFYPERIMELARKWLSTVPDSTYSPMILHNVSRLLFLAILALMVVFFGSRRRLTRGASPLLLVLLTLDLFLGNKGYAVKLDANSFHEETRLIRTLKSDTGLFRFNVAESMRKLNFHCVDYEEFHLKRKNVFGYDLMMEHHLFDVDGYNVPLQPRFETFLSLIRKDTLEPPMSALLNMLNVKYVLADKPIDMSGYVLVGDGPESSKLYKNENFLPRAFLIKNYQVMESSLEFAKAFHDPAFDPQQALLLEKEPERYLALKRQPAAPQLPSEVKVATYENNRMILDVSTSEATFLFMSEAYYPGWKAYVDGREEEILRANYVFRAIPVGPGTHKVELVMQPRSFKVGLVLSLLTIVLLLTGWAYSAAKNRLRFPSR